MALVVPCAVLDCVIASRSQPMRYNIQLKIARVAERALVQLQKTLHKLEESIDKHQQTAERERQQQVNVDPNPVVRLPVEITEYYSSEKSDRPVKNRREKTRTRLEIAGVIIASAVAVLTFLTLAVFYGQLNLLTKQTNDAEMDARASRRQGREEIRALQLQVTDVAKNTQIEQRAWIDIQFTPTPWKENESLKFRVIVLNTGRTPAKHLRCEALVEKLLIGERPHFGHVGNRLSSEVLQPNVPVNNWGFQSVTPDLPDGQAASIPMSHSDIQELDAGKAFAVVHGIFNYEDVFGASHWVRFCSYNSADISSREIQKSTKSCVRYNDIDSTE
jgi:hypothetical protein